MWLASSPLAPRLEDEPWLWEVSAAPPEDAFSLLHASLLLSAITRASSCCRASCGAHRTNTGEVGLVHEQREKENAAFQRRVDSRSLVSCVTRKSLAEMETRLRVLALILAVLNILSTTAHAQAQHSSKRHSVFATGTLHGGVFPGRTKYEYLLCGSAPDRTGCLPDGHVHVVVVVAAAVRVRVDVVVVFRVPGGGLGRGRVVAWRRRGDRVREA